MAEFWILLAGALCGISCGLIGSFLILRKQAMLADAISHAVLPGIALAFLILKSRQSPAMLAGAAAFGLLTVFLVEMLQRKGRLQSDAAIGVTFTALFALGVLLISVYGRAVDWDQDCVLFGEIALVPWDRLMIGANDLGPKAVWSLSSSLALNLLFVTLFYKELKVTTFDPLLARSLGMRTGWMQYGFMACVSLTAVAAFESVGAILVVALLVVPPAAAFLLTTRLSTMLLLSATIGAISAILGYYVAAPLDVSISGMMAVVAGVVFTVAAIWNVWKKRSLIIEPLHD